MSENQNAIIVRPQDRAIEGWSDPARGSVTWRTFISGDITASSLMSAGLAELEPHHGALVPHRPAHSVLKIFYVFPTDKFSDVVYRF